MGRIRWWVVLAAAGLASACLQKDTTSTVYLEADGTVTWTIVEHGVRSDAEDAAERDRDEQEYVAAVAADRHPAAEALRALGGRDVRTEWLRDRRPWSVRVDASFDAPDAPWAAALTACGIPHASAVSVQDGVTTWRAEWQVPDEDRSGEPACAAIVEGLADALEGPIVLARGRFVGAVGFDLDSPGRAVLSNDTLADGEPGARRVLSLSWTAR